MAGAIRYARYPDGQGEGLEMAGSGKPQWFSAMLHKVGINRCVDVPEGVGNTFGPRRYVPVVATVKGHSVRTTLVPGRGGRYRLFLNGDVRKAAGVDAGDKVSVVLMIDKESREIPVPKDLAKALSTTKGARAAFETLTPFQRRSFVQGVLNAKRPETRERRIRKGIELVLQMATPKSRRKGKGVKTVVTRSNDHAKNDCHLRDCLH